ncbi:hypothetical protein OAV88_03060 [bacterium]|nr:hypothetical protein [bacterium]
MTTHTMPTKVTIGSTNSQIARQSVHPLEMNDAVCVRQLDFVTLEFLETAKHPIPKNQQLNKLKAFGELTGRTVLVALSHGWFYQMHPDPQGVKIDIIVNTFGPRLRYEYPETQILFFYDFLSVPQYPRTALEEERFKLAMKHMNSVYVYCDIVLFIETRIPPVDSTLLSASIRVSDYKWTQFVDTIQVASKDNPPSGPQQYDCIVKCDNKPVQTVNELKTFNSSTHVVKYLNRPFGRPNTIINNDRGWLFLERITIAIKAATAGEHRFDSIVRSNSKTLRSQIYIWMRMLLRAAKDKKELRRTLERFDGLLKTKKFSFMNDIHTVKSLMTELVENFAENWETEIKKQESGSKRLREILLRWGEFSNEYVKKARLLEQENEENGWMFMSFVKLILASTIGPALATFPFVWSFVDGCVDNPIGSSIFIGTLLGLLAFLGVPFLYVLFFLLLRSTHTLSLSHTHTHSLFLPLLLLRFHSLTHTHTHTCRHREYLGIPLGWHNVLFIVYCCTLNSILYYLFGIFTSGIPPFAFITVTIGSMTFSTYFYKIKVFTHEDKHTGMRVRHGIHTIMRRPKKMRFDRALDIEEKELDKIVETNIKSGLLYPILGSVFFQSGVLVQCFMVPLFFALRAWAESTNDKVVTKHYGSDTMINITFNSVMLHEVCLSLMITSIKHPLVFATLVLADVFENVFCLWSLARTKRSSSSKIVPMLKEDQNLSRTTKSLKRRSSSVYRLTQDLMNAQDDENTTGTALFISATLLQRELIETLVPLQALGVLSCLYYSGVQSNSTISQWKSYEDYNQAMFYMCLDLAVELIVFACSVITLHRIYPQFSSWRILMGLARANFVEIFRYSAAAWLVILMFTNTLSGLDLQLRFEWIGCDGENATWVGGFDWEGCS